MHDDYLLEYHSIEMSFHSDSPFFCPGVKSSETLTCAHKHIHFLCCIDVLHHQMYFWHIQFFNVFCCLFKYGIEFLLRGDSISSLPKRRTVYKNPFKRRAFSFQLFPFLYWTLIRVLCLHSIENKIISEKLEENFLIYKSLLLMQRKCIKKYKFMKVKAKKTCWQSVGIFYWWEEHHVKEWKCLQQNAFQQIVWFYSLPTIELMHFLIINYKIN